jgi:(S)-ureidoglycine aminohydrolase
MLSTMPNRLGHARTVVTPSYALFAPDSHVASALPGWTACRVVVQISAALGARFSQYLITLDADGRGYGETGPDTWFFFVVAGAATVNAAALSRGGFAYVPPGTRYAVGSISSGAAPGLPAASGATLLVFRKKYEPQATTSVDHAAPTFFTGHEQDVTPTSFLGDPHARLQLLIPDTPAADMAVNVFTYDPGATLPFVESHVMEHGLLFLAGGGVYRLNDDWHPVTAGDAIWMAPYCPQWFIAAGPEPARYIYYKDVNRVPA